MSTGEPATTVGDRGQTEVGSVFVSNYPPYSFWRAEGIAEVDRVLAAPALPGAPLGLYLHVPFCRKRCKFCYFRVYTDKNAADVEAYLDALGREVENYAGRRAIAGRPLRFVYFGGGTPSFISARSLRALVTRLRAALDWSAVEEVTFECEPGTLTQPKLAAIREVGVTRLSLGVESFDDRILAENGRAHVSREIHRVLPWVRELGFPQLNIDLIAGMIGETEESWRASVRQALEAAPDSLTIYQLELPYNTVYSGQLLQGGALTAADWPTKRAWQDWAIDCFLENGYEVSSAYTLVKRGSGARFVYRDAVWHGCDLVGAGVSAFSHVSGVHFQNAARWESYLERVGAGELPLERAYATTPRERLTREMILQLKLGRIDPAYFRDKFGVSILDEFAPAFAELERRELLRRGAGDVRLTRQGLLQVDGLLPSFYAPEHRNARYT
ncbi:MAG TPA: coproporphyrinogen-III oxidase family protein [Candidatus Polarisedimenticolaceae bacterium]|nr:coproporphyrinogen-III oxidase family protein [Candidatus Polarisedimenticolaceae bacterium]